MDKKSISDLMREWGRKGGKASGKARMIKLTPEQRSEIARKASAKSAEVRSKKAAAKKKARKNSEPTH
jgi:general stress protein YciG